MSERGRFRSGRFADSRFNSGRFSLPNLVANGDAETGALAHWLLGDDNPTDADLIGGVQLTGTAPVRSAGYIRVSAAAPLDSTFADRANLAVFLVVRRPAGQRRTYLANTGNASGTGWNIRHNNSSASNTDPNNFRLTAQKFGAGTFDVAPSIRTNQWQFVGISLSDNGDGTGTLRTFQSDSSGNATFEDTASSPHTPSTTYNIALGDIAGVGSFPGDFEIAEFGIFDHTKTEVEFFDIMTRSVSRLAARSITVSADTSGPTASVPAAPNLNNPVEGDEQNGINWSTPDDGGSAITDYEIQTDTGGGFINVIDGINTISSFVHTGLTNGTAYSYRVRAVNAIGPGPWSNVVTGTPFQSPYSPINGLFRTGDAVSPGSEFDPDDYFFLQTLDEGGQPKIEQDFASGSVFYISNISELSGDGNILSSGNNGYGLSIDVVGSNIEVRAGHGAGKSSVGAAFLTIPVPVGDFYLAVEPSVQLGTDIVELKAVVNGTLHGPTRSLALSDSGWWTNQDNGGFLLAGTHGASNPTGAAYSMPSYTSIADLEIFYDQRLIEPDRVPDQVMNVQVEARDGENRITWAKPFNGGLEITDYVLRADTGGGSQVLVDGFSDVVGFLHTGLTNGVSVTYDVAAVNSLGTGEYSELVTGTPAPATAPSGIIDLEVIPGDEAVAVRYTEPADNGATLNQRTLESYDGSAWVTVAQDPGLANPYIVTGLTNGENVSYRMTTGNAAGTSVVSNVAEGTPTLPSSVRNLVLVTGANTLQAYWQPPVDTVVRGYIVTVDGVDQPETVFNHFEVTNPLNGAHSIEVRSVGYNGNATTPSLSDTATVSDSLPPKATVNFGNTITMGDYWWQTDVDVFWYLSQCGGPVALSDRDFKITATSHPAGLQPGAGNQIGNGMMKNYNVFGNGGAQAGDEKMALGDSSSLATTRNPYDPALQVDPALAGPIQVNVGDADSYEKWIRRNQVARPWAGAPGPLHCIGDKVVLTVMPYVLPEDSYVPAANNVDKASHLKFARNKTLNVFQSLPAPDQFSTSYSTALLNMPYWQNFVGESNGERQNSKTPEFTYAFTWLRNRRQSWMALHYASLTILEKHTLIDRNIRQAVLLESIIDQGYEGRSGTIQGGGEIEYLYFAGFALQDADMLTKAFNTRSSELSANRHNFFTDAQVGTRGDVYPDTNGQANQPVLAEHVGQVHSLGDAVGTAVDARYAYLVIEACLLPVLAMMMLKNGPSGENGMQAIQGNSDPRGPGNPRSAATCANDVNASVSEISSEVAAFNSWRPSAPGEAQYENNPKQIPWRGGDGNVVATADGCTWDFTGRPDLVSGTYDYSEVRYSPDLRNWVVISNVGKSGAITGLVPGQQYYFGIRHVDTLGRKGIWSENRGGKVTFRGAFTPTGTPAASAPANKVTPTWAYRPYETARMPIFEPLANGSTINRNIVNLFPAVGDWSGYPAPAFEMKVERFKSGGWSEVMPYTAVDQTIDGNWDNKNVWDRVVADMSQTTGDTRLRFSIRATNSEAPAGVEVQGPEIVMPDELTLPPNVLIDTEFGPSFVLDYPDVWANIASTGGLVKLFSARYTNGSEEADTPGYIFLEKDGATPLIRILPDGMLGVTGETYRIDAEFMIGPRGSTEVSIRGGPASSKEVLQTYPYDAQTNQRVYQMVAREYSVTSNQNGINLGFEILQSAGSGGTSGTGCGISRLKIERIV